jgi:hypothetical protein
MSQQVNFSIHAQARAGDNVAIEFFLPHSDRVTVKVYDLSGHERASIVNTALGAGSYRYLWDAARIPAGLYAVRMIAGTNRYRQSVMVSR